MNLEKLRAMDQRLNPQLYSQNANPDTQTSFAPLSMPMSAPIPINSYSSFSPLSSSRPPSPYKKTPELNVGACYEIFENNVSGAPASQGVFKFKGEVRNELQFTCVDNSCANGASKYGEDYYYSKTLVKSSIGGNDQYEFKLVDCPPDRKCVKTKNSGMSCAISGGKRKKRRSGKRLQTKKKFRKTRKSRKINRK
jgi:hypothetical protein